MRIDSTNHFLVGYESNTKYQKEKEFDPMTSLNLSDENMSITCLLIIHYYENRYLHVKFYYIYYILILISTNKFDIFRTIIDSS